MLKKLKDANKRFRVGKSSVAEKIKKNLMM